MNIKKDEVSNAQLKLHFLEHGEEHSDAIPIYTDGSKSNEGTGCAGVLTTEVRREKLGNEATIFTAELYVILNAMEDIDVGSLLI